MTDFRISRHNRQGIGSGRIVFDGGDVQTQVSLASFFIRPVTCKAMSGQNRLDDFGKTDGVSWCLLVCDLPDSFSFCGNVRFRGELSCDAPLQARQAQRQK